MDTAKVTVVRFMVGHMPTIDAPSEYTLRELGQAVSATKQWGVPFVVKFGQVVKRWKTQW